MSLDKLFADLGSPGIVYDIVNVRVYAPGFINHERISPDGFVTLDEGDSLNCLYHKLNMPLALRLWLPCSVNYKLARRDTKLKDGDVVTFLFPVSGG